MRGKIIIIFAALVLIFSSYALCQEQRFSIEGKYWMPSFSMKLRAEGNVANPTIVDDKLLDIKRENFVDIRAQFKITDAHAIRATYTPISYKGDTNITETINFGDQIFPAGAYVESKLKMDYFRAAWLWKVLDDKKGTKLYTILEGKIYLAEATLDAPYQPAKHKYEVNVGVPTIGLLFEGDLGKGFGIYAEATGIYAGDRGYLFDAEAGLNWKIHKNIHIDGGYRAHLIDFNKGDDMLRLKMYGPYVGLKVKF